MVKIVLNGFPVFRGIEDGSVTYRFFEEDNTDHQIFLSDEDRSMIAEYEIVMNYLCDMTGANSKHVQGIRVQQVDAGFVRSFFKDQQDETTD